MIQMQIIDKGVISGLSSLLSGMKLEPERILDKIADNTREKMRQEAPEFTGLLRSDIHIAVETNKRIIEPVATNLSGKKYAQYVEAGTGPAAGHSQYMPNAENLALYFGASKSLAWAIALSIKEKGTKANDFVNRTYTWLQARMSGFAGELANNITAYYVSRR